MKTDRLFNMLILIHTIVEVSLHSLVVTKLLSILAYIVLVLCLFYTEGGGVLDARLILINIKHAAHFFCKLVHL